MSWIRQNVRSKGKMEERYMLDGLFILQRISTSFFCPNANIIHQNYFSKRNNYDG